MAPRGSVVLVHGSSASSASMHVLARAFARAGYGAYALDMRGHGDSGSKGQIDYVGQLEDDLDDFMRAVQPAAPATLAGFSAGGGFALRLWPAATVASCSRTTCCCRRSSARTRRPTAPGGGGWVRVGVPRIVAVTLLDALGVKTFHHLPVMRFALNDTAKAF